MSHTTANIGKRCYVILRTKPPSAFTAKLVRINSQSYVFEGDVSVRREQVRSLSIAR